MSIQSNIPARALLRRDSGRRLVGRYFAFIVGLAVALAIGLTPRLVLGRSVVVDRPRRARLIEVVMTCLFISLAVIAAIAGSQLTLAITIAVLAVRVIGRADSLISPRAT